MMLMGMYTGLRFKVIVKEKYREKLNEILNVPVEVDEDGNEYFEWKHIKGLPGSKYWSQEPCCNRIPWGLVDCMPDKWDREEHVLGNSTFNKETGEWRAICSLKNYGGEISKFMSWVLSCIVEDVKYIEVLYEEWDEVTQAKWYSLKDLKEGYY